ncbi:MAG: methyltransferase domain-containing protein [Pseudomonadota bacterium]|nr:methyltransferase domain-containing protein [Pseudomonadota bacterium]
MSTKASVLAILLLAGCRQHAGSREGFPQADRAVAPTVSDSFSTEDARDRVGEAEDVMNLAGIKPGMSVADIGAGEGYYTVRLAPLVGSRGRVLAEDIIPAVRDRLADRAQRERLDNVAVRLGKPDDPLLPAASFDRIFLVHMYHEVDSPYAFLWHLRTGLKPNGEIIVVDADRPTKHHGTPPARLGCEFKALGLTPIRHHAIPGADAYFVAFKASAPRPAPAAIIPCVD